MNHGSDTSIIRFCSVGKAMVDVNSSFHFIFPSLMSRDIKRMKPLNLKPAMMY